MLSGGEPTNRKWKEKNPEAVKASRAKYEKTHREELNAKRRARRAANPEKYREANREKNRRYQDSLKLDAIKALAYKVCRTKRYREKTGCKPRLVLQEAAVDYMKNRRYCPAMRLWAVSLPCGETPSCVNCKTKGGVETPTGG